MLGRDCSLNTSMGVTKLQVLGGWRQLPASMYVLFTHRTVVIQLWQGKISFAFYHPFNCHVTGWWLPHFVRYYTNCCAYVFHAISYEPVHENALHLSTCCRKQGGSSCGLNEYYNNNNSLFHFDVKPIFLLQEGTWLWSDGSKFNYKSFYVGEPNNCCEGENCLEMNWKESK